MNISFSSLMKQLKKLLKQQKKRWISLAVILLVASASVAATAMYLHNGITTAEEDLAVWLSAEQAALVQGRSPEGDGNQNQTIIETIQANAQSMDVYYQRNFVCGEELEHIGMLTPEEIKQLSEKNPLAVITVNELEQLYFTETVNDLSQQCKENAYFGLDKDGNLSLFEGLPAEEQIIRTFFQLNVQHLKSSLPSETLNQLYEGIRIMDVEDYHSVLSTFSDFAVLGGRME
ncbi:BofC C-terminal domain-containing protein [Paenibacillus senegalensis]|uniref:BofC C-terminal domain-containing protein n=1 Tax=Paenibacillus senegalensis TaxID=1465766 RepID=UPI000289E6BF|nr:BofC C-terminal domain-containing protein [Paenibacillus senegalensis]